MSGIGLFFGCVGLLFFVVDKTAHLILQKILDRRASYLVNRCDELSDLREVCNVMKIAESAFHTLVLVDFEGKSIHGMSSQLNSKEMMFCTAHHFEWQGKSLILYLGVPTDEFHSIVGKLKLGMVLLVGSLFVFYSVLIWIMIHRLSSPLQRIIGAIGAYQKGDEKVFHHLSFDQSMGKGDFHFLVTMLNSLVGRVQEQIEHLKLARIESEWILESLGEGVIAVDSCGCITFINSVACKMLGASRDFILGRSLDHIETEQKGFAANCYEVVHQALQTHEPSRRTWDSLYKERIHLDLIATPCFRRGRVILVIQDKTSDHQVLEMGKDFIANASHELRTPVTIIQGFAETLQDHPRLPPETLSDIASKIVHTSKRFEKLIKSLLMLTHLEQHHLDKLQPIDLIHLAEGCKNLLSMAHPTASVNLSTNLCQAPVVADPQLLDLAIMNLLENAITYSFPLQQIEIVIYTLDLKVCLEVRDRGIGIPEASLPYIFNRFYTVDKNRSRKAGGTGLGLSIVKTVIGKHGGTIAVSSQLGIGTVFTVSLPLFKD